MAVTVNLSPIPKLQFNQNGVPVAGGKLFTYAAGTSTKLATYADAGGTTTNNNPVILDSNGQCNLFLQGGLSYKLVLSPATDTDPPQNPYWTEDQVTGINQVLSTFGPETGVANAYAVTLNPALTSYADGQQVVFDAGNSSTAASTLNVNGLGPKQLLVNGQATVANSIQAGQRYVVSYKASTDSFLVLSSSSPSVQGTTGSFSGAVSVGGTLSGASGGTLTTSSISTSGSISASGAVSVGAAAAGSTDAPQIAQTLGAGATTYANVTSSRTFNATYTNSTSRPLFVALCIGIYVNGGQTGGYTGIVNGAGVASVIIANPQTGSGLYLQSINLVVPPGATYGTSVSTSNSPTVQYWYEY